MNFADLNPVVDHNFMRSIGVLVKRRYFLHKHKMKEDKFLDG